MLQFLDLALLSLVTSLGGAFVFLSIQQRMFRRFLCLEIYIIAMLLCDAYPLGGDVNASIARALAISARNPMCLRSAITSRSKSAPDRLPISPLL